MNYQKQCTSEAAVTNFGCCCGNNTWRTPRNNCGCGSNTWRTPRSTDCGCGSNTWRTPRSTDCGCGSNTVNSSRNTDCGCENTVADTCDNNLQVLSRRNAGTVWKNRSSCCNSGATLGTVSSVSDCGCQSRVTRTATCYNTPCAQGASEDCPLSGRSLAMVYSPHQEFQSLYDPREGLCRGTVFCELDKPFYGSGRGC